MADKITQKFVASLKPPSEGNRIYYDKEVRGFGVRITANHSISFVLNYRTDGPGGRCERRCTIGAYPVLSADAARNEAIELRKKIRGGVDPLAEAEAEAEQQKSEHSFADLAREYLKNADAYKRASSVRNDRQMIETILTPRLGELKVGAIQRRDIETIHTDLKSTPYRANRVLALARRMLSLAIAWNWRIGPNPARAKGKQQDGIVTYDEPERESWLSEEQLGALEKALDEYPNQDAANALRLLILTGSRATEVLAATWNQFDLEQGVWTKPSHHTKQKKTEHVPLSQPAIALLRKMEKSKTGEFLFPGEPSEKGDVKARVTIRRPWIQVCKAAGLADLIEAKGKRRQIVKVRPKVRIHDLRHTFASHLVSNGASLRIVGKLLGHTQSKTTERYAHLADSAVRDAANAFGVIAKRAAAGK